MDYPRPHFETEFLPTFSRRWQQGEHVFINGQTGSGKTELMQRLLSLRGYPVIFVTKPRDPIFKSPLVRDYTRMHEFKPTAVHHKILLSAKEGDSTRGNVGNQYNVFGHALDRIFAMKGWTVGIDESLWLSNRLKLGSEIGDIAYLGRALNITGIYVTQRPAHIPVIIPQSASHAFIGKTGRQSDLKTLAELYHDPRQLEHVLRSLRSQHEFAYVDTQGKLPIQIIDTHY